MIDAIKQHHLCAERYDREFKDIITVQDQITKEIIIALQVPLTGGEEVRIRAKGTESLDAYLRVVEARAYQYRNNKEDNAKAQELIKQAITLDPNYAVAYWALSWSTYLDVWFCVSKSPRESLTKAIELAKKAVELDHNMTSAQALLGQLFTMVRQHERAIVEAHKAVDLDLNSPYAHFTMSYALNFAGKHEEAIPHFEKTIRLNPLGPPNFIQSINGRLSRSSASTTRQSPR